MVISGNDGYDNGNMDSGGVVEVVLIWAMVREILYGNRSRSGRNMIQK